MTEHPNERRASEALVAEAALAFDHMSCEVVHTVHVISEAPLFKVCLLFCEGLRAPFAGPSEACPGAKVRFYPGRVVLAVLQPGRGRSSPPFRFRVTVVLLSPQLTILVPRCLRGGCPVR